MMKHEFEKLIGETVTPETYALVEAVYRDHPSISDVNGKREIAKIYKNDGIDRIYEMFKEINPDGYMIKYWDEDMYTTYGVDFDNYIREVKFKMVREVFKMVCEKFRREYPDLSDEIDYFTISVDNDPDEMLFPDFRWIAVYYVKGDSEGYYVHVDAIEDESKRTLLFLAKTLLGRDVGEKISNALSRVLEV